MDVAQNVDFLDINSSRGLAALTYLYRQVLSQLQNWWSFAPSFGMENEKNNPLRLSTWAYK